MFRRPRSRVVKSTSFGDGDLHQVAIPIGEGQAVFSHLDAAAAVQPPQDRVCKVFREVATSKAESYHGFSGCR